MSLEWKSCKIGDVVSVRRGSSPRPIKEYVSETGMPWVKIADATKDQTRFINFTSEFIKEDGIEKTASAIYTLVDYTESVKNPEISAGTADSVISVSSKYETMVFVRVYDDVLSEVVCYRYLAE